MPSKNTTTELLVSDSLDDVDLTPHTLVRFRQRKSGGGWSEGAFIRVDDGYLVVGDSEGTRSVIPEEVQRFDFSRDEVLWTPVYRAPSKRGPVRPDKAKRLLAWSNSSDLTDQYIYDHYYKAEESISKIAADLGESRTTVATAVIACGFEIRPEPPATERLPLSRKKTSKT